MVRTNVEDIEDLHWYIAGVSGAGGKENRLASVYWVYIFGDDVEYIRERIVDSLVGDWDIEYSDPDLAEDDDYIDPPEKVKKVIKLTPPE